VPATVSRGIFSQNLDASTR